MQPLKPINIHHQLIKERNKTINEQEVLGWVYSVLNTKGEEEMSILNRLTNSPIERSLNNFDIDKVDTDAIFHVTQIQKICSDYRLRFLDTKYFKLAGYLSYYILWGDSSDLQTAIKDYKKRFKLK